MNSKDQIQELRDRIDRLERAVFVEMETAKSKSQSGRGRHLKATRGTAVDFSMPIRAFVKKHSRGMTGSKKFTLVVAYLVKGKLDGLVPLVEVQKNWNKMTGKGLLGMKFNGFYTASARENDWVHTTKTGAYSLRPKWTEIFQ